MSSVNAAGAACRAQNCTGSCSTPACIELAHGRIYANHGAMTPGADGETADGMSQARTGRIIDALRHERYRFQPVKRIYIPKKNGKHKTARPAVLVG